MPVITIPIKYGMEIRRRYLVKSKFSFTILKMIYGLRTIAGFDKSELVLFPDSEAHCFPWHVTQPWVTCSTTFQHNGIS